MTVITDYIIAQAGNLDGLRSSVLAKCKEGYKPQGGITITNILGNTTYYQAMIKELTG